MEKAGGYPGNPRQLPQKVCLTIWGDSIDQYKLKAGEEVNASIDIESREYNGKWYTDVKAWKIEKQGGQAMLHRQLLHRKAVHLTSRPLVTTVQKIFCLSKSF